MNGEFNSSIQLPDYQITQLPDSRMVSAVLFSGGLDSAALLVEEAAAAVVQPIYVSVGAAWEAAERTAVGRLLAAWGGGLAVRPLTSLLSEKDSYSPLEILYM